MILNEWNNIDGILLSKDVKYFLCFYIIYKYSMLCLIITTSVIYFH